MFTDVPLVKESHMTNPDSNGGETDFSIILLGHLLPKVLHFKLGNAGRGRICDDLKNLSCLPNSASFFYKFLVLSMKENQTKTEDMS